MGDQLCVTLLSLNSNRSAMVNSQKRGWPRLNFFLSSVLYIQIQCKIFNLNHKNQTHYLLWCDQKKKRFTCLLYFYHLESTLKLTTCRKLGAVSNNPTSTPTPTPTWSFMLFFFCGSFCLWFLHFTGVCQFWVCVQACGCIPVSREEFGHGNAAVSFFVFHLAALPFCTSHRRFEGGVERWEEGNDANSHRAFKQTLGRRAFTGDFSVTISSPLLSNETCQSGYN